MNTTCSLSDLSDEALDRGICEAAADKHTTDARLLAFIAEYDARSRYVALGYESLRAFCVQRLRLTDDAAYKRTQAARVALKFPVLFAALADARLHLSAVNLLAPRLTAENVEDLIAAATHKSNAEIRQLLAERFPRKQPSRMSLLPATEQAHQAQDSGNASAVLGSGRGEGLQTQLAPEQVEEVDCWARITPLSGDRYSVSLTIDRATHELWRHNQSLLSHQVHSGNLAEVLRRSLAESARQFEKRRFRSSGKARRPRYPKPDSRYIPKHVRDAVWHRDGGQCAYVGETGHVCGSRTRVELDHIVPVALGGASTVDNLRLRCRVHNQHEAERVLGADFMKHKRTQAREVAGVRNDRVCVQSRTPQLTEPHAPTQPQPTIEPQAPTEPPATRSAAAGTVDQAATDPSPKEPKTSVSHESSTGGWLGKARARATAAGIAVNRPEPDVESVLRHLGANADDARRAARLCETIPEAPLEERLRVALSFLYARPPAPRVAQGCGRASG